jgi:hypothetical protein
VRSFCCSIAMGCLFVDREKGDGGKQINKEVQSSQLLTPARLGLREESLCSRSIWHRRSRGALSAACANEGAALRCCWTISILPCSIWGWQRG